jgi:hypothetical protein
MAQFGSVSHIVSITGRKRTQPSPQPVCVMCMLLSWISASAIAHPVSPGLSCKHPLNHTMFPTANCCQFYRGKSFRHVFFERVEIELVRAQKGTQWKKNSASGHLAVVPSRRWLSDAHHRSCCKIQANRRVRHRKGERDIVANTFCHFTHKQWYCCHSGWVSRFTSEWKYFHPKMQRTLSKWLRTVVWAKLFCSRSCFSNGSLLYCIDRGYAQMPRCLLGSVQMPQAKHKISEPPQSCGRIRAINFQQTHIEQRASDCGTGQAVSFEVMPFKWQSGVLYCLSRCHAFQMAVRCIVLFSSRSCLSNGSLVYCIV